MSTPREVASWLPPNWLTKVPEGSYSITDESWTAYTWWLTRSTPTPLGLWLSMTPRSVPSGASLWSDVFHWTAQIVPSVSTAMSHGRKPRGMVARKVPDESNL